MTPTEPRVFLTQETALNVAQATRFGKLTAILPRDRRVEQAPAPVLRELRRRLATYSSDDYVLPLGSPVLIAMAVFIAAEVNSGLVNLLVFDRKLNDYYPLRLDLFDRQRLTDGDLA